MQAPPAPRRPPLVATIIATSFGAGFMPKGPGTAGTVTAIPMAWALGRAGGWVFVAGLVAVTLIGTWASSVFVDATGTDDDQRIVVDEVAGYLLTLSLVPRTAVHLALAFVLFRLFDIWKPGPIRWVDQNVGGGFGVMADDLAAGAVGALILLGLESAGLVARLAAAVGLS